MQFFDKKKQYRDRKRGQNEEEKVGGEDEATSLPTKKRQKTGVNEKDVELQRSKKKKQKRSKKNKKTPSAVVKDGDLSARMSKYLSPEYQSEKKAEEERRVSNLDTKLPAKERGGEDV